jgi:hypothetical protein
MVIQTLERLKQLPVGEKMIAYVGNFEYDIARCDKQSSVDAGAPKYKQVLYELWGELRHRVTVGEVELSKSEKPMKRTSNKGSAIEWRDFVYEVTRLR